MVLSPAIPAKESHTASAVWLCFVLIMTKNHSFRVGERAHPLRMGENHGSESSGTAKRLKYLRSCSMMEKKRHPPSIQQRTEQNKHMKDKRIEKVKQHYFISLNGEQFKILKHKTDAEKALSTIRTKVFGQNFPHGDNILVSTSDDNEPSFVVAWKGMWKDEKVECWEYRIIT